MKLAKPGALSLSYIVSAYALTKAKQDNIKDNCRYSTTFKRRREMGIDRLNGDIGLIALLPALIAAPTVLAQSGTATYS
jgi:hypothetical protein